MIQTPFVRVRSALLASLLILCAAGRGYAAQAPEFAVATPSSTLTLAAWRGQVVYVDFWASWCGPCAQSFPWMNTLHQRYSPQGLRIVAINLDKQRHAADNFLRQRPAQFMIGFDPAGTVAQTYQVRGMPASYLIDRKGVIRLVHEGFFSKDTAALEREIQKLLAEQGG